MNLLPIKSKEPDEIIGYLVDNVTPIYAFVYASAFCIEDIYRKSLLVGFDSQPSVESTLALMYDSVKHGYFDIHEALTLIPELQQEKRSAILEQSAARKKVYSNTSDPLPYFAPHSLIESIRSLLRHYNEETMAFAMKNIKNYEGRVIAVWHTALVFRSATTSIVEDLYIGNTVYNAVVSTGDKYPDQKHIEKSVSSAETEMFKLFKNAINSAKKFATE